MERVERVEDFDMFVLRAQGIVSAEGYIRTCIPLDIPYDLNTRGNTPRPRR